MSRRKSKTKKIFGGIIALAIVVLGYYTVTYCLSQNNSRYYMQGLSFIAKKDYQNAYYNFSSAQKGNEFYCPAKYRAALAAQNLYDTDSSIEMYKDVINGCSGTIFEEVSKYNLAKFYFQQKNYKKAEPLFDSLIKSAETEKYQIASNYFLGEIQAKKHPQKAFDYYIKYLEKSPDGKYSKSALVGILQLKQPIGTEEHYIIGVALYKNSDYAGAKSHFIYVPIERSWYYLAMCAEKLGSSKQAGIFLDKGLREYSQSVDEESLHNAIDVYSLYSADRKNGYFNSVNILVPKGLDGGDYAMFKYGAYLTQKDRIPYYHKIVEKYPKGAFASDASWNLLYLEYKRNNYKNVIKLADEHSRHYPNNIATPRVLFFAGKSAAKLGKFAKAKEYFGRVLAEYPDDYYAFRAKLILDNRKTAWTFKNKYSINQNKKNIPFPLQYCKISTKSRSVLNLLIRVKDWALLEDLLDDNEIVKSWANYKSGNKSLSIVQARDFLAEMETKPTFSSPVYKLAYPLYYVDEINTASKRYDLDAYIVMAIIREESHFTYNAQSYVGAGGLMQVMPDTARFIANEYGINYNAGMHNDVEQNIELGCAYLDYALGKLSKKYLFAVAGYNGGHNAVNRWRNNLNYDDFDEFVEEVPYSETQTYIRKVFKSYWNYLNIYDKVD